MEQPLIKDQLPPTSSKELQRIKGRRKWAPKSRDGCAICRSKRVKCDEARPSCFRCRRIGVECHYPSRPAQNSSIHTKPELRHIAAQMLNWSRTPSYGTPEETRYLGTFRHLATPLLGKYMYNSLFTELTPQASWSHPGVRHALVAASMSCEELLCDSVQVRPHRTEWHYARALQHLYQDSNLNGDIAIIAAVLLWLHDMFKENTVAAMVHMIGFIGMTMEKKMRKMVLSMNTDLEITVIRAMTGWGHHQALETRELPDQAIIASMRARIKSDRYADVAGPDSEAHTDYEMFMFATGWTRERGDRMDEPPDVIYLDELYEFCDRWYAEFSCRPGLDEWDQRLIYHYHRLGHFNLDSLKPGQFYVRDDDYETWSWINDVLDWLESIGPERAKQAAGKKDFILALNNLPTQLEYRTKSMTVFSRVLALLSSWDRIEGMWHSKVLAKGVYASKLMYNFDEEDVTVSKASLARKVGVTLASEG